MKLTKTELGEMIRECLREELAAIKAPANNLKESAWACYFDDKEIGTVEAATEEEALEKMQDKYPEYDYGMHDGCFGVEPLTEGAFSGGYAEGGFKDTAKRAGGAKKNWKDALEGKKTKTVKAKDLKPGMVTETGEVKNVKNVGWQGGKPTVEISYGGIGAQGSYTADVVAADKDYEVLDESLDETLENIFTNLFKSSIN